MSEANVGLTALDTRGKIHFGAQLPYPACGSRAKILGFRYVAAGEISVSEEAKHRLCSKCIEKLRLIVEESSDVR